MERLTSRDGCCIQQYREDHEGATRHKCPDTDASHPHHPGHCHWHCHCVMIIVMKDPCSGSGWDGISWSCCTVEAAELGGLPGPRLARAYPRLGQTPPTNNEREREWPWKFDYRASVFGYWVTHISANSQEPQSVFFHSVTTDSTKVTESTSHNHNTAFKSPVSTMVAAIANDPL